MPVLSSIGGFFKRLFGSAHNQKAMAVTAERVALVVADADRGNITGAIVDGEGVVSAAKSINALPPKGK